MFETTVSNHGGSGRPLLIFMFTLLFFMLLVLSYQHNFIICDTLLTLSYGSRKERIERAFKLTQHNLGNRLQEFWVDVPGQKKDTVLHACVIYNEYKVNRTILICHGNTGNVTSFFRKGKKFVDELNANVILFDYAGFGLSTGKCLDETDLCKSAKHVLLELYFKNNRLNNSQLFVYGISLGGLPAMYLSSILGNRCNGLFIENSVHSMALILIGSTIFKPLSNVPFLWFSDLNSRPLLSHTKHARRDLPILIIASKHDRIVSNKNSLSILEDLNGAGFTRVRYFQINNPRVGHTNAWKKLESYFPTLRTFMTTACHSSSSFFSTSSKQR